jgi:hypothetical protein
MRFPSEVIDRLKYYIYLYLDPSTEEVFYVGKGHGNRAFVHLDDTSESEKTRRIAEIRERGKEPKIEVLIHGLEANGLAMKVEAAVIDLIGVHNLTNKVRGWRTGIYGRMEVSEAIVLYSQEEAAITEPAMLIWINRLYRYGMTPVELYDATRGVWRVGPNRSKMQYALAVYEGVVKEVYEVKAWFPGGSTFSTRNSAALRSSDRWEFVGTIAMPEIREKYIAKSVRKYSPENSQNPIRYVSI